MDLWKSKMDTNMPNSGKTNISNKIEFTRGKVVWRKFFIINCWKLVRLLLVECYSEQFACLNDSLKKGGKKIFPGQRSWPVILMQYSFSCFKCNKANVYRFGVGSSSVCLFCRHIHLETPSFAHQFQQEVLKNSLLKQKSLWWITLDNWKMIWCDRKTEKIMIVKKFLNLEIFAPVIQFRCQDRIWLEKARENTLVFE